ncbi:MAG: DUF3253 domain-containing protein [Pseudomonadota bacterium]
MKNAIMQLLMERGAGKTICPSEAARAVDPENWRAHLKAVRAAGRALAADGRIVWTRKGEPVDPETAKGVVRFGLPPDHG